MKMFSTLSRAFVLISTVCVLCATMQLSGCQSLGLSSADTLDQKLAYAYGVHTAVLQTAVSLSKEGVLTPADDTQVLSLADQSRQLLDAARAVEATDKASAGNKLALATSILSQLQTYLNTKKPK